MKKKIDTRKKLPFYIDPPKEDKSKLALFLRARDHELAVEQAEVRNNQCPNCHVQLSVWGVCVNDCGYVGTYIRGIPKKKRGASISMKKTMTPEEITKRAMELMLKGMPMSEAMKQAFEELMKESLEAKHTGDLERPTETWTYKGDLRCPVCSKYSKVWTKGSRESVSYKLECHKHGLFFRTPERNYWRSEATIQQDVAKAAQA